MKYSNIMAAWAGRFDCFFNWPRRPGDAISNLYPLLGISRASHAGYLGNPDSIPEYIACAMELFELLPVREQMKWAGQKLAPRGWPHVPTSEVVDLCVKAWYQATGVELYGAGVESTSVTGDWTPYVLRRLAKSLLEYDQTGTAGMLALEGCLDNLDNYVEARRGDDQCTSLRAACFLRWLINLDQIQQLKHQQIEQLRETMLALRVSALTGADEARLAYFPIDTALNAHKSLAKFKKLTVDCVSYQESAGMSYAKFVYLFDSVADLVVNMQKLPMGFALCIIKCSDPADSFFAIAVRTSTQLHLISDQPQYEYPLKSEMLSSRNSRFNAYRMDDSYLPYELLNLVWSEDLKRTKESDSMVIATTDGLQIAGHIAALSSATVCWLSIVFTLCFERYFQAGVVEPKLALPDYSKIEQLHLGSAGAESEAKMLPAVVEESVFVLEPLESKDVSRSALNEAFPELKSKRHASGWMDELYGDKIDSTLLNITPGTEPAKLLAAPQTNSVVVTSEQTSLALRSLVPSQLRTAEETRADALFIARYNQSLLIKEVAEHDFQTRKAQVLAWVYRKMAENLPNIIDKLVAFDHAAFSIKPQLAELRNAKTGLSTSHTYREVFLVKAQFKYLKEASKVCFEQAIGNFEHHEFTCHFSGEESPDYRICLAVSTACDIELLTGIPREELPPELRTYGLTSEGRPGLMLDIADPVECLHNPWDQLEIFYRIPVSIQGLNERRKALGLPRLLIKDLPANYWDAQSDAKRIEAITSIHSELGVNMYPNSRHRPNFSYV